MIAPALAPAAAEPVYRVVVDAPSRLAPAIERSVGLVRWQNFADMTFELLERLAREAPAEAGDAAAAEGFFSARVEVAIDRSGKPAIVTLTVAPGEPTRIASVRIDVNGPAAADTETGSATIAEMHKQWLLPEGEVFRQAAWAAAKDRALAILRASPYAAAAITRSEALIDPEARTARLTIEVASGPAFHFGRFEITGLQRYEPAMVENFSTIRPGDRYSQEALDRLVRRLNSSGYFSSVQASIDPDVAHPDAATVRIAVIEAPTRRLEVGLRYSTDVQFAANFN